MSTAIGSLAPVIKRAGAVIDEKWMDRLVVMRIDRAVGLVGRMTMRFTDDGYSLSAADVFTLGTKVSVAQSAGGALFEGMVTGVSLEQSSGGIPELVVVIDDGAYKLSRGTKVVTHLNTNYSGLIRQMAQAHGLMAKVDAKNTTESIDYLLQTGTDLEFLNSIVERLGAVWWVEGEKDLKVTNIEVGSPAVTLTLGEDLDEFSVRASGLRPTDLTVNGWDPSNQQELNGKSTPPTGSGQARLLQKYLGAGPTSALTAAPATMSDVPPLTNAEATTMATARYADWATAAVVARGAGDVDGRVKPGVTVAVKDAGPASGNYLVTQVEHVYTASGFTTRFTAGPRRPSGLVDTLGTAASDPGFLISGLVVGVVTDNNDPDNAGRVKVRYTGINGKIESPWARVVTLGAGAARGAVFQPEVDDEVLVGFERSDTRRPVVIGGLFSKKNQLPSGEKYVTGGAVTYRRITSRKNHVIELADGNDPTTQHILLALGTAQHKLRLGTDRFDIEVAQGKPLTIKAGAAKFDISQAGDITIEANNITVKANMALKLEAGTQAELKGTAQVAVQGAQVQVKADGVGSVEAAGPLTIKGAVVAIN